MISTTKYFKPVLLIITYLIRSLVSQAQPDISIEESLKNNGESWTIKVKQKFLDVKPASINFGPVKTIEIVNEASKQLGKDVNRELFWKNVKTIKSRRSTLVISCNDNDTAVINMLTITTEEEHKRNATGVLSGVNADNESSYRSSSIVDKMLIQFNNDSARWQYEKMDSATVKSTGYTGALQSATDSFFIKQVDNYSGKGMKDIAFSQPASGFIFLHNGKQVAALQVMMNKKVWITKEINAVEMKALLAVMAGFASVLD